MSKIANLDIHENHLPTTARSIFREGLIDRKYDRSPDISPKEITYTSFENATELLEPST